MPPVPVQFYSLAFLYLELQVVCEEKGKYEAPQAKKSSEFVDRS